MLTASEQDELRVTIEGSSIGLGFLGGVVKYAWHADEASPQTGELSAPQRAQSSLRCLYFFFPPYEQRAGWFVSREGVYEALTPDAAGVWHSEVFPGLWLKGAAMWAGDLAALLAALREGLASPEHAAFVARLQAATSAG